MTKFYEIRHPITGYIYVHGSDFESEGEIREEWLGRLGPSAEQLEPRDIQIREIQRHELGVPEQMDNRPPEEMEEIYARHRGFRVPEVRPPEPGQFTPEVGAIEGVEPEPEP